jgi:uncharacterized cupin superfamily protein
MAEPFTHKQLSEVEDSAKKFGFDEFMESRFAREDLDAERTGLSYHRIKPGQRQAFGHHHTEDEEICVIVRGTGLIKLDDEIVEVEELDAIRIAPEVVRALQAGDDGLDFLVFGTHTEDDAALDPDWWTD